MLYLNMPKAIEKQMEDPKTCPPEYLLWYHHLSWDYKLASGNTLWDELCFQYHQGAKEASQLGEKWASLESMIDEERFNQVDMHLQIQANEAKWWRDACLSYFQSFSQKEIPDGLENPEHDLKYYQSLIFPYAPGIRPRW